MSDQKGRRIPLIISLAVYCLSSLLCTIAPLLNCLLFSGLFKGFQGLGEWLFLEQSLEIYIVEVS